MEIFPELSFNIGSRIVTESIPILLVAMLIYIYYMIDRQIPKWWVQGMVAVSGVFCPCFSYGYATYSYLLSLYLIVAMLACGIGFYASILEARKKNKESILFFAGVLCIIIGAVNDTLVFYQIIDTDIAWALA